MRELSELQELALAALAALGSMTGDELATACWQHGRRRGGFTRVTQTLFARGLIVGDHEIVLTPAGERALAAMRTAVEVEIPAFPTSAGDPA